MSASGVTERCQEFLLRAVDGAVSMLAVGFRLGHATLPGRGPEPRLIGWDGERRRQHDPPVFLGHNELIAFFEMHPVDEIARKRQDVLLTVHGFVQLLLGSHEDSSWISCFPVYQ